MRFAATHEPTTPRWCCVVGDTLTTIVSVAFVVAALWLAASFAEGLLWGRGPLATESCHGNTACVEAREENQASFR